MADGNAKTIKNTGGTQTGGVVSTTSKSTAPGKGKTTGTATVTKFRPKMRDIVRENPDNPITVAEARKIAFDLHEGDKDKLGVPYASHLEAVRQGVVVLGGGEAEQIAALMHDAEEDLHTTFKRMREAGFTEEVIDMVDAVSKRSNEEQSVYLERIIAGGKGAIRVKVADLLHNLRHDRVAKIDTTYTRERLLKKYRPALARLLMELELIVDEDEQKKLATKPVGSTYGTSYSTGGKPSKTVRNSTIQSMIKGDWPVGFPAPVLERMSKFNEWPVRFMLANGEVLSIPKPEKFADEKMDYFAKAQYVEYAEIVPTAGVSEDAIAQFINMVN